MNSVHNDLARRTLHMTLSGFCRDEEIAAFCKDFIRCADEFKNEPFFIVADMRGLKALSPASSKLLTEIAVYVRTLPRQLVVCAHVSDQTISRLQTLRVAHEANPEDPRTRDCRSLDEAEAYCLSLRSQALVPSAPAVQKQAR